MKVVTLYQLRDMPDSTIFAEFKQGACTGERR